MKYLTRHFITDRHIHGFARMVLYEYSLPVFLPVVCTSLVKLPEPAETGGTVAAAAVSEG
jgi:hypothetical protein